MRHPWRLAIALMLLPVAPLGARPDSRTHEVFRYGCANELGKREVTLFANGTIRLVEGMHGEEGLGLAELNPEEMAGALNRLREEDLARVGRLSPSIQGMFMESCELRVEIPGEKPHLFHFGLYDALPLAVSRVLRVVEDMAARVQDLRGLEELPADYEPQRDDVLRRRDGQRYRIVRFTPDEKGVELHGLDHPFVLFVVREEMKREFVALLSRRD